MRPVRTVANIFVAAVVVRVSVRCNVMRDVFVNWSNMLAWFVPWTIAGAWIHGIVLRESFVVS